MKKKIYLIISVIAIFIAITGSILFYKNKSVSYIPVTTKYWNNNTESTYWTYQYTDKYKVNTNEWDFSKVEHVYVLQNGKWEIEKKNETQPKDSVAMINVEKKSKGAYLVLVQGTQKSKPGSHGLMTFNDAYIVDCATSKVTELQRLP